MSPDSEPNVGVDRTRQAEEQLRLAEDGLDLSSDMVTSEALVAKQVGIAYPVSEMLDPELVQMLEQEAQDRDVQNALQVVSPEQAFERLLDDSLVVLSPEGRKILYSAVLKSDRVEMLAMAQKYNSEIEAFVTVHVSSTAQTIVLSKYSLPDPELCLFLDEREDGSSWEASESLRTLLLEISHARHCYITSRLDAFRRQVPISEDGEFEHLRHYTDESLRADLAEILSTSKTVDDIATREKEKGLHVLEGYQFPSLEEERLELCATPIERVLHPESFWMLTGGADVENFTDQNRSDLVDLLLRTGWNFIGAQSGAGTSQQRCADMKRESVAQAACMTNAHPHPFRAPFMDMFDAALKAAPFSRIWSQSMFEMLGPEEIYRAAIEESQLHQQTSLALSSVLRSALEAFSEIEDPREAIRQLQSGEIRIPEAYTGLLIGDDVPHTVRASVEDYYSYLRAGFDFQLRYLSRCFEGAEEVEQKLLKDVDRVTSLDLEQFALKMLELDDLYFGCFGPSPSDSEHAPVFVLSTAGGEQINEVVSLVDNPLGTTIVVNNLNEPDACLSVMIGEYCETRRFKEYRMGHVINGSYVIVGDAGLSEAAPHRLVEMDRGILPAMTVEDAREGSCYRVAPKTTLRDHYPLGEKILDSFERLQGIEGSGLEIKDAEMDGEEVVLVKIPGFRVSNPAQIREVLAKLTEQGVDTLAVREFAEFYAVTERIGRILAGELEEPRELRIALEDSVLGMFGRLPPELLSDELIHLLESNILPLSNHAYATGTYYVGTLTELLIQAYECGLDGYGMIAGELGLPFEATEVLADYCDAWNADRMPELLKDLLQIDYRSFLPEEYLPDEAE